MNIISNKNLQQIPKTKTIPMGKLFIDSKEKFNGTTIRFRTYLTQKSHADDVFSIPRTYTEDCGCSLHVPKPQSRTMLNALKIEAKRHKKRKGSEAYHNRIQKKWDKRVLAEGSDCKLAVQVYAPKHLLWNRNELGN